MRLISGNRFNIAIGVTVADVAPPTTDVCPIRVVVLAAVGVGAI